MILLSGSLLCSACVHKWFVSIQENWSFSEAPDVLVDVAYGVEDNDGNEKKKVKFKFLEACAVENVSNFHFLQV